MSQGDSNTDDSDDVEPVMDQNKPDADPDAQKEADTASDVLAAADALTVATHSGEADVYWVGNPSKGTAYRVDLRGLEGSEDPCTCPDEQYRPSEEEFGVCKHVLAALDAHPTEIGLDRLIATELRQELDVLRDATDSLLQTATTEASQTDGATSPADVANGTSDADAEEAAERLQDAFDDVIDDMQVTANEGLVWFQTGRDTPDEWPFPGGDDTFDVVTGPDVVSFVHDGSADWADGPHKWHDDKPGEWWKNALEPDDVDDYVAEVLE